MRKPLYNMIERRDMRELDCTLTAVRKLNLAVLHLLREYDKIFTKLLNYGT